MEMRLILLWLLIPLAAMASPREEATEYLDSLKGTESPVLRLEQFSKKFLGLPYGKNGPLGEGELARYDADPLYRFDTFDCTTFVETMVALALSDDIETFEQNMNHLRYDRGEVGYLSRNHFPSLQWIPNNLENGIFVEVNDHVLPAQDQKMARALINIPGWLAKLSPNTIQITGLSDQEKEDRVQELRILSREYKALVAELAYLSIDELVKKPKLLNKIPNGTIVNFVRPNWDLTQATGTHMNVSHQGILIRKGETLFLRHASTSGFVKEENFLEYLRIFSGHATLKGIHLMGLRRLQ